MQVDWKGYVNSDQFRLPFNNKSQFMSLKYPALLAFIFLKSFTQKILQRLLKVYNDNKKIKIKIKKAGKAHTSTVLLLDFLLWLPTTLW